jgi:hypothetical protein
MVSLSVDTGAPPELFKGTDPDDLFPRTIAGKRGGDCELKIEIVVDF